MPIIGLNGRIGSGKNTVADRLEALFPGQIKRVSFFARLKVAAASLLGVTVDDLEAWKNDPEMLVTVEYVGAYRRSRTAQSVRSFLQRFGDTFRELYGEDYLLDALPLDGDYRDFIYVATDVRLPAEADRVRELGGKILAVVAPSTWEGSPIENAHVSERELPFDGVILNEARGSDFSALDVEIFRALDGLGYIVQGHRFEGIAP